MIEPISPPPLSTCRYPRAALADAGQALAVFALTSAIPVLGVLLGVKHFNLSDHVLARSTDWASAFANWDGEWYERIAVEGYSYDPQRNSSVAFFPAFPLLGRSLAAATGLRVDVALAVISNTCLAASFVLLLSYMRCRGTAASAADLPTNTLLAMALLPVTFFFRMAYSESLFLLLSIAALYGMANRWHLVAIAAIIGASTGCRMLGVALILPFLLHLWHRSRSSQDWCFRGACLLPLCSFGLLVFMAYQYSAFGNPTAFVQSVETWSMRPRVPLQDKLLALLAWEPIWSTYLPGASGTWKQQGAGSNALFSLQFANPLYFVAAAILLVFGIKENWLTRYEVLYSIPMLAIPYLGRAFEMNMASQARYAFTAFPLYIVVGHLLCRTPNHVSCSLFAVSGFFLGIYSAMFASWYMLI